MDIKNYIEQMETGKIFINDEILTHVTDFERHQSEVGNNFGNFGTFLQAYIEHSQNGGKIFSKIGQDNDRYKYFLPCHRTSIQQSIAKNMHTSSILNRFFIAEILKPTNHYYNEGLELPSIPAQITVGSKNYQMHAIILMPPNHYTIILDFENSLYYFDSASVFFINDPKSEIFKDFVNHHLSFVVYEEREHTSFVDIPVSSYHTLGLTMPTSSNINPQNHRIHHTLYSPNMPLKEVPNPLLVIDKLQKEKAKSDPKNTVIDDENSFLNSSSASNSPRRQAQISIQTKLKTKESAKEKQRSRDIEDCLQFVNEFLRNNISVNKPDDKCPCVKQDFGTIYGVARTLPENDFYEIPKDTNYSQTKVVHKFYFCQVVKVFRKVLDRIPDLLNADIPLINYLQTIAKAKDSVKEMPGIDQTAVKIGDILNEIANQEEVETDLEEKICSCLKRELPNINIQNTKYKSSLSDENYISKLKRWRSFLPKFPLIEQLLPKNDANKIGAFQKYWTEYKVKVLTKYEKMKNEKTKIEIIDYFTSTQAENRATGTLLNWITKYSNNPGEKVTYNRGGCHCILKRSDDLYRFVLLSTFIAPEAKPRELAEIASADETICAGSVSSSLIKQCYKDLHLSGKNVTHVHFLKDSTGFIAMRKCWAIHVKKLIYEKKMIPSFVDEASVKLLPTKAHSFKGTRPLKQNNLSQISISIIIWTIPFAGFVFEIRQFGYTAPAYTRFILRGNHIVNTLILSPNAELFTIQDNNIPHKAKFTENFLPNINISLLNSVEYSPELNGVAENMFKFIKTDDLYNVLSACKNSAEERIEATKQYVFKLLESFNEEKMQSSFIHWLKVLDHCDEGMPLDSEILISEKEEYFEVVRNIKSNILVERKEKENSNMDGTEDDFHYKTKDERIEKKDN